MLKGGGSRVRTGCIEEDEEVGGDAKRNCNAARFVGEVAAVEDTCRFLSSCVTFLDFSSVRRVLKRFRKVLGSLKTPALKQGYA